MSKNRDKEGDKAETRRLILDVNRPKYTGGVNWLGHGPRNGGQAVVDDLLLDGATMERLVRAGRRTAVSNRSHFQSLKRDHDLLVTKDEKGSYLFDRVHLGLSSWTETVSGMSPQPNGAGFGDPVTYELVWKAAVAAVTNHYRKSGWTVRNVEKENRGYDLECRKGRIVERAEVKGVSGTEPNVMITANELRFAQTHPEFVLYVVTSALTPSSTMNRYARDEFKQLFEVVPMLYRAMLRR